MNLHSTQPSTDQPAPPPGGWQAVRTPDRPADRVLSPLALRWSAELPPELRPHRLQCAYPRVANRIALCWCQAELADAVLSSLLFDNRDGLRQGFPKAIVDELWALRHEVEQRLAEGRVVDLWGQHSDATWVRPSQTEGRAAFAARPLRMYGKIGTGY